MILGKSDIEKYLPHRTPFVFVDEVQSHVAGKSISTTLFLDPSLPFFKGHFPNNPIMPGVLITESLAQTCGLLLALDEKESGIERASAKVFYLATNNMKFSKVAKAGDTLTLNCSLSKKFGTLAQFSVEASVGRDKVASGVIALAEPNS